MAHNTKEKLGTVTVSARIDTITLEAAARFLQEQGDLPQSRSDLIWRVLEYFVTAAEGKGLIKRMTDVYEAVASMESMGLGIQVSERNRRQIARSMQAATMCDDFNVMSRQPRITKKSMQATVSFEDKYQAMCAAREMEGMEVITRAEFAEMKAIPLPRTQNQGTMSIGSPSDDSVAKQIQEAAERTKQELRALGSMMPKVVPAKPASEQGEHPDVISQGEPTAPASTISTDGN
jgi:hypothetical protein